MYTPIYQEPAGQSDAHVGSGQLTLLYGNHVTLKISS